MGSLKRRPAFDPRELEIIDRVYNAAWAQILTRHSGRNIEKGQGTPEGSPQAAVHTRRYGTGGIPYAARPRIGDHARDLDESRASMRIWTSLAAHSEALNGEH